MPTAKLTSKGQITIPRSVRAALRLRVGDRVQFHTRPDRSAIMQPAHRDLMTLRGSIKPRRTGVTTAEMDRAIRERAARHGR